MSRARHWFIAVPVVIGAVVALLIFWFNNRFVEPVKLELKPHVYKQRDVGITDIQLKVFYAVPKNRIGKIVDNWEVAIEEIMPDILKFHNLQFHNFSNINYAIYPEPVILEAENLFYDTLDTNRGNPEALKNVSGELERRYSDFLKTTGDQFLVLSIIYEGVGSSGSTGVTLFSHTFLTSPEYLAIKSSLFYHEFGHALGLPDQYDISTNEAFSSDIMGSGRRKPIDITYVDRALLKEMGL